MKRPLMILMILITAVFAVQAQMAKDDRRTISVTGEAFAFFAPDRASISIGVETDGRTVLDAKSANDRQLQALIKAIKGAGVADKDIRTSGLNIQPVYDYKSDDRRLIKYTMRNQVVITVQDLSKLERILNDGLASGANVLNGVQFYIEDVNTVSDSLRLEAAEDARTKADAVARTLGATVLRPLSIQVSSGGGYPQPMYKGMQDEMQRMSVASSSTTEVSAGEIRIDATVHVIFEIE